MVIRKVASWKRVTNAIYTAKRFNGGAISATCSS